MKQLESILKNILLKILLIIGKIDYSKNISNNDLSGRHLRILLIRLNRIGDALVSTPLIKLLKDKLDCEIEILADKKNSFIFENNPSINKTIVFRKGISGFVKLRNYINKSSFDVIVDMHDDISTTVSYIIAASKVPLKFGLAKSNNAIFTNTIERPAGNHHHIIERILELANLFSIEPIYEEANVLYYQKNSSVEFISNYLNSNFNRKKFVIGINISAGSTARFWGIERFQKLLHYLSNMNLNIVLISPPNYFKLAKTISGGKFAIFSDSDFDKAAALVSKLDLLFTPDTSLVHIASAFQVSVFGLYVKYETDEVIWYPYKSKYETVVTKEPDFQNLDYEKVVKKFIPFLRMILNDYQ